MSPEHLDSPGVKVPPPAVFAGALLLGLIVGRWLPQVTLPRMESRLVGAVLVVAGFAFGGSARIIFLRRGTSVLPTRPSTAFVVSGPFRVSRNPMYVGFTAAYVGISLLCLSVWPLLLLPLVVLTIRKTAIDREESYLERRFGAEYANYKASVRRWI